MHTRHVHICFFSLHGVFPLPSNFLRWAHLCLQARGETFQLRVRESSSSSASTDHVTNGEIFVCTAKISDYSGRNGIWFAIYPCIMTNWLLEIHVIYKLQRTPENGNVTNGEMKVAPVRRLSPPPPPLP